MARGKTTINMARSSLQAVSSGSGTKVARRIGSRAAGKATGRLLGRLFK